MEKRKAVRKRYWFWNMPVLLIILATLNGLDLITTKCAIGSGVGVEGNPLSRTLLELGLLDEVKLFMSIVLLFLALVVMSVEDRIYKLVFDDMRAGLVWHFTNALILFTVLFYVAIVLNNLLVLIRGG